MKKELKEATCENSLKKGWKRAIKIDKYVLCWIWNICNFLMVGLHTSSSIVNIIFVNVGFTIRFKLLRIKLPSFINSIEKYDDCVL